MSREEKHRENNKQYYQVVGGTFRTKVPANHHDAEERINKLGKQVFERKVPALFGLIQVIVFETSPDYGESIKISLDPNEDGNIPVLSFGVESKDGRDVLRKLPGIDLNKEIKIAPYRYIPEGQKEEISGVSIYQQGQDEKFDVKLGNFFFDNEKKEYIHGHPTIDWDSASDAKKKIYKVERDEFLKEYTKTHVIPKLQKNDLMSAFDEAVSTKPPYPTTDISPDDIPFN